MAGATAHNPGSAAWCFARTERDGTGAGRREAQGGSDKYIYVCVNIFMCSQLIQVVVQQKPTQLQRNYPPIKNKIKVYFEA